MTTQQQPTLDAFFAQPSEDSEPTEAIPAPDADQQADTTVHVTLDPDNDADSRLAQLQAAYAVAKNAADAATAELDAVKASLKAELTARRTDDTISKLQLAAVGDVPGVRLAYVKRTTVDTKQLKAQQPEIYAAYAKTNGSWRVESVKS